MPTRSTTEWREWVSQQASGILSAVGDRYGLCGLSAVGRPVGGWNAVIHARGRTEEYGIKVFNGDSSGAARSLASVETSARLMSMVREAGFRELAPPIRNRRGRFCSRYAGYPVLVFPWLTEAAKGCLVEDKAQDSGVAATAGRLLASLHMTVAQHPTPLPCQSPALRWLYGPSRWARKIDDVFDAAMQSVLARGGTADTMAALRRGYGLGCDLVAHEPAFFYSPKKESVVHGDYRPENLVYDGKRFLALLDFDMHHRSLREAEVAYGALSFAGPRWFIGARSLRVCRAFLNGYREVAPVDDGFLSVALLWAPVRYLSLSFKPEQVEPRLGLCQQVSEWLSVRRSLLIR